jgi:hypothetical protein
MHTYLRKRCKHERPELEQRDVPSLHLCFQLRDGFLQSQKLLDGSSPSGRSDLECSYQVPVPVVFMTQHEESTSKQKSRKHEPNPTTAIFGERILSKIK